MKINVEQLPSGAYRIRKTVRGKTYRVTVDYKPTESEALRLLADVMGKGGTARTPLTFGEAAERHLSALDGVLSASTLHGYRLIINLLQRDYKRFCAVRLSAMRSEDVQRVVMHYGKAHKPKTVRNVYGFITAVLRAYAPDITLRVNLPAQMPTEPYIPSESDIRAVYAEFVGTPYEAPFRLALCGMRRSEICALTLVDLTEDNRMHICKAKIQDRDGNWIISDRTKTPESTRYVRIPDDLADLIRRQGYVYKGAPGSIGQFLALAEDKLGLPRFSLHKLRHYYVSYAHTIGIPDSYTMQNCGYKSDAVMKRVYRHALEDKRAEMDKRVLDGISGMLS